MNDQPPPPGYRFGPPEQRGVVAGLQAGQIAALAGAGAGIVVVLRALPADLGPPLALTLATATGALILWPVGGRPLSAWLALGLRMAVLSGTGRRGWRSAAPGAGARPDAPRPSPLAEARGLGRSAGRRAARTAPPPLGGVELRALHAPGLGVPGDRLGVAVDPAGTYTAVLWARSTSFALLGRSDQHRRLAGWASVLASLARERSAVRRVQWLERTLPGDGADLQEALRDPAVLHLPAADPAVASYRELLAAAGPVTQGHELLIALQLGIHRPRPTRRRSIATSGAPGDLLARELATLARRLREAEIEVVGLLGPAALTRAIRAAFAPTPSRPAGAAGEASGRSTWPWPLATELTWATYRTDGFLHATFWIAEWPRSEVGPDFLSPLLVQTQATRTVAVTMQPVPPLRAIREAEAARVAELSDAELRGRAGFVPTARHDRRRQSTAQRETELVAGHADVRFSGYVTVTAREPDALEQACVEVEHAAQLARLELRRLYGLQDIAFGYTLPLCRGLQ